MPPFSKQQLSSFEHHLTARSVASSADGTHHNTGMVHTMLERHSSPEIISPALAPLAPLSSFGEAVSDIHFANPNPKRDTHNSKTHELSRRALQTNVIPLSYNFSGAKPGVVVGATLGAVAGILFIIWLVSLLMGKPATGFIQGSDVTDVHVRRTHVSPPRSRRTRRTRTHRSSMSERSSPPRRNERILVEERRRTQRSRPPPEPPLSPEIERDVVDVEERETERRVENDDVVEVIEEGSSLPSEPPRRKKSGYRTVDPHEYGGGNFPQKEVYESDRRRRRHH